MNKEIEEILAKLIEFRDKRDWKQFHKPKDLAMSIAIEAAELMQEFQWKTNDEIYDYLINNKEKVSDEIADIMAYVLLLSNDLNIDLIKAIENKIQKNSEKYPIEKAKGNSKKYTEL